MNDEVIKYVSPGLGGHAKMLRFRLLACTVYADTADLGELLMSFSDEETKISKRILTIA